MGKIGNSDRVDDSHATGTEPASGPATPTLASTKFDQGNQKIRGIMQPQPPLNQRTALELQKNIADLTRTTVNVTHAAINKTTTNLKEAEEKLGPTTGVLASIKDVMGMVGILSDRERTKAKIKYLKALIVYFNNVKTLHETTLEPFRAALELATAREAITRTGVMMTEEDKAALAELQKNFPKIFANVTNFLNNPKSKIDDWNQLANTQVGPETSTSPKLAPKITSILNNVQATRDELPNTQTISDHFKPTQGGSQNLMGGRKLDETALWGRLLDNPNTTDLEDAKKLGFVSDSHILAEQKKAITKARKEAEAHGFTTNWIPHGLSGSGVLFSTEWSEPRDTSNGGPLKVSVDTGLMLGGRVRMARITTEIPGNFTTEQKAEMLLNFNSITDEEGKNFQQKCEKTITRLHGELMKQASDETIFEPSWSASLTALTREDASPEALVKAMANLPPSEPPSMDVNELPQNHIYTRQDRLVTRLNGLTPA